MGVAGSGKSTLASELAAHLSMVMIEADEYHSEQAIALMRQGKPLNDTIRESWIKRLVDAVNQQLDAGHSVVLAYSGLKQIQRQQFDQLTCRTTFLFLELPFDVLQNRLSKRKAHFFPVSLLQSQFDDLEPLQGSSNAHVIDANKPVEALLNDCLDKVQNTRGAYV
jgi:carbohydrate kinase (thermoresistant glucokinase family)